mgnify:CR=1 FL=1
MRIAMVGLRGLPATFGGIEKHVEELGWRLAERGHEVSVFCRPNYAGDLDLPTEFDYVAPVGRRPGRYRGMILRNLPTVEGKGVEAFVHSGLAAASTVGRGFDVVHFHALGPGVGPIFLPMYLPILALGLLASWRTTVLVGLIAPLLSAVLTGMPPLAPPVALLMAAELAALAGVAGAARRAGLGVWPACVLALIGSRVVGVLAVLTVGHALGYNKSVWEYAVLSLGVAWPGMIL